jgi:hypothetical protein
VLEKWMSNQVDIWVGTVCVYFFFI